MIEKRIEHIAYKLSENRKENQPGAIVLIGAGCSVSAGIPTAGIIVDQVLEKHKDNPDIKAFGSKPSYADLMACLGPVQRKAIFRDYVGKARINVSHIYLAHLLAEGYVDYILTVNFDDLALRAMALYNVFPPVYDLSILKDLTTTTLDTRSLTFLHGRHNGLWQLNTRDEMAKIGPVADSILNKIANNRPWIVVGYSGDDFIFDRLVNLGRFENGLYWIGYQKEEPSRRVREKLLDNPLSESFWVKGYDADSFFLALNSAMPIGDPGIFNKPFSFLAGLQENIKDIDGSDEYKAVKVRFETSKEWVQDAINKYETTGEKKPEMTSEEISLSQLKKALVDCLIAKKYDDLESLEQQVSALDDPELRSLLASIYFNWGTDLGNEAQAEPGPASVEKFRTAFEKYAKSLAYNPQKYEAYYNWGCDLRNLSDQVTGPEQEAYTLEACDKFREALRIHPQDANSLINWGKALGDLAAVKQGDESDSLAKGAFTKYEQASHINPDDEVLWSNWGTYLGNYANRKRGEEAKALFLEAFEKYTRSIGIIPDRFKTSYNWGIHLSNLADMREGDEKKEYFLQSIQKLSDATRIE
ncbi:MAG TPA: hypothetical protein PLK82_09305, partial [Bacteroidales bacterium]|nr:hypothetical protein [Bacteroidales bacterium]